MQSDATWHDPSEDLFFELLSDIERGDETFMVVERLDQESGDHYLQTILDAEGNWIIEYRSGGAETHRAATIGSTFDDKRLVHQVVVNWAYGFNPAGSPVEDRDWQTLVAWGPLEP